MTEKTQRQLVQETHQGVTELKTVLLGVPGTEDTGLCGEVKAVKLTVNGVAKSHGKLKRNFWLLVGTLVGSGVIGGSLYTAFGGG